MLVIGWERILLSSVYAECAHTIVIEKHEQTGLDENIVEISGDKQDIIVKRAWSYQSSIFIRHN